MVRITAKWFILCRVKHLILNFKEIFYQIVHTSVTEVLSWLMCPGSIRQGGYT